MWIVESPDPTCEGWMMMTFMPHSSFISFCLTHMWGDEKDWVFPFGTARKTLECCKPALGETLHFGPALKHNSSQATFLLSLSKAISDLFDRPALLSTTGLSSVHIGNFCYPLNMCEVSFALTPEERQHQKMFKPLQNCSHFTCYKDVDSGKEDWRQ